MKFVTGNVIKTKRGSIEIVSKVTDESTDTISFDRANSCGYHKNKTYERSDSCYDCDINDGGFVDEDCPKCKGTGNYMNTIYGMDKATLLAPNVKEYIIKSLTQNFNF